MLDQRRPGSRHANDENHVFASRRRIRLADTFAAEISADIFHHAVKASGIEAHIFQTITQPVGGEGLNIPLCIVVQIAKRKVHALAGGSRDTRAPEFLLQADDRLLLPAGAAHQTRPGHQQIRMPAALLDRSLEQFQGLVVFALPVEDRGQPRQRIPVARVQFQRMPIARLGPGNIAQTLQHRSHVAVRFHQLRIDADRTLIAAPGLCIAALELQGRTHSRPGARIIGPPFQQNLERGDGLRIKRGIDLGNGQAVHCLLVGRIDFEDASITVYRGQVVALQLQRDRQVERVRRPSRIQTGRGTEILDRLIRATQVSARLAAQVMRLCICLLRQQFSGDFLGRGKIPADQQSTPDDQSCRHLVHG